MRLGRKQPRRSALVLGDQPGRTIGICLVLIGDEYLLRRLRWRHQRALFSRIRGHCRLHAWSHEEVREYLRTSLAAVGIEREPIEPDTLAQVRTGILYRQREIRAGRRNVGAPTCTEFPGSLCRTNLVPHEAIFQ